MMKYAMKTGHGDKINTIAALMVFCVFTVSALTVLALGVSAYKTVTDISEENYSKRVSLSYIWTKIKNGDEAGMVYIGEFRGIPALFIEEEYDGAAYHTVIYHYDGHVYELFSETGLDFSPEDGTPVTESGPLSFGQPEDGLIKVSAGSESMFISPRGRMKIAFAGGPAE